MGAIGIFITIFGCGLYGFVRYMENKDEPQKPKETPKSLDNPVDEEADEAV